jgi:hypothetical protein
MATPSSFDSPPVSPPADAVTFRPSVAEPRDSQPPARPHSRPVGELSPESLLQRYLDLSG